MKKLTLKNCRQESALLLDYEFIDNYMPEANGEYVKVYLLLLRCQASPDRELTVSGIADILDDTEKDVIRALKYWKKTGILDVSFNSRGTLTDVVFYPLPAKGGDLPFWTMRSRRTLAAACPLPAMRRPPRQFLPRMFPRHRIPL